MKFIRWILIKLSEYALIVFFVSVTLILLHNPGKKTLYNKNNTELETHPIKTKADEFYLKLLPQLERDCTISPALPCFQLARIYEDGLAGVQNKAHARKLQQLSCSMLYNRSCSHLARMYDLGIGGPKDSGKADLFYAQSCIMQDYESCSRIGRRLVKRGGHDVYHGFRYFEWACRNGHTDGCEQMNTIVLNPNTPDFVKEKIKDTMGTEQNEKFGLGGKK